MKILNRYTDSVRIKITLDELYTLHQALNEVCHGLHINNFDQKFGANPEEVRKLMLPIEQSLWEIDNANKD